jgi:hypothetical protein
MRCECHGEDPSSARLIIQPFQDDDGVFYCYYQCEYWPRVRLTPPGVPSSTEWSHDIGWGRAWSADGIRWDIAQEPVMMPGDLGSYDHMGVFTVGRLQGIERD